ncbi:m6 protein [Colletotrichum kahawae]|uniref:M6 protein n=1 Tax=Colletotrichum kahawae TaxID=34407 RepID=A0AAD9Y136_COLKA|nr:m6 protein [Colletotrichum kahawae]
MKTTFAFLTLLLAATAIADPHRLCACRDYQATVTSDEYSKKAVNAMNGKYVFSGKKWTKEDGAPYEGSYYHAIEGPVNGAEDDGWIGGDESFQLCRKQKGFIGERHERSACFTPKEGVDWRDCGPDGNCFTSKATKTDGFGKPVA